MTVMTEGLMETVKALWAEEAAQACPCCETAPSWGEFLMRVVESEGCTEFGDGLYPSAVKRYARKVIREQVRNLPAPD